MATPADILEFIVIYKQNHNGNSPSLDDIAGEFGMSKSAVKYTLDKLSKDGYITRNGVRNITVPNSSWAEQ
jgi:DNA-binding MarR family transcriptional regulator